MSGSIQVKGDLGRAIASLNTTFGQTLKVGILEGAKNEDTGQLIAPYAAANEFGTSRIPARPFMRNTIDDKNKEWAHTVNFMMEGKPITRENVRLMLEFLGNQMMTDIKMTIQKQVPPPNAPSTIARKKSKGLAEPEHTLIDTGSMLTHINYEIEE